MCLEPGLTAQSQISAMVNVRRPDPGLGSYLSSQLRRDVLIIKVLQISISVLK